MCYCHYYYYQYYYDVIIIIVMMDHQEGLLDEERPAGVQVAGGDQHAAHVRAVLQRQARGRLGALTVVSSVYIYICIYIHTYMYIYIYIYIH